MQDQQFLDDIEARMNEGLKTFSHQVESDNLGHSLTLGLYAKISDIPAFFKTVDAAKIKNKNGKTLQEFMDNIERLYVEGLKSFMEE